MRSFRGARRTALYLAADGRCEGCAADLDPGWHADHVQPYSRGGATDVINGQALCPACNLRKGSKVNEKLLRAWQSDALVKFMRSTGDFLAVATPGAGKTTFALAAARALLDEGAVEKLIVVVPSKPLRRQWGAAAASMGIRIDYEFTNSQSVVDANFHGPIVTYASVAAEPHLYRRLSSVRRTLVILDEVHHGGDHPELSWGRSLLVAFEHAARRLLLSGTPSRTDRNAVPFVSYDAEGKFVADVEYPYGAALEDRDVVRPVEFLAFDGEMRWKLADRVQSCALVDAEREDLPRVLAAAYDPDGEWIASVLTKADAQLTVHRAVVPDAGGLVVAADQTHARAYARMLAAITGEPVTLAISEETDSSERIEAFSRGATRWLVAVQMVSEGVDIPRLAVGVYASKARTPMFFQQVVGRFVRMRGPADETTATILIPSVEPLLTYAREITKLVNDALREEERQTRDGKGGEGPQTTFDLLDSSPGVHVETIIGGESFTDVELASAAEFMTANPWLPGSLTPTHIARMRRALGMAPIVGRAVIYPSPVEIPLTEKKRTMRRIITRKVGRLSHLTDTPHKEIYTDLIKVDGCTQGQADLDQLQQRSDLLDRWIAEADGS